MPNTPCACPACNRHFVVPDDVVGRMAKCPGCRQTLLVKSIGGRTTLVLSSPEIMSSSVMPSATAPLPPATNNKGRPPGRRLTVWIAAASFAAGALAMFVCGGGAVWLYSQWSASPAIAAPVPGASDASPPKGTDKDAATGAVDVAELHAEAKRDPEKFRQKYHGKKVTLSGRVTGAYPTPDNTKLIRLQTIDGCYFDVLFTSPADGEKAGASRKITVSGLLTVGHSDVKYLTMYSADLDSAE
jgi:hypothetical protein